MADWGYCRFCKRDVELRVGAMADHYAYRDGRSQLCIGTGSKPTQPPAETG